MVLILDVSYVNRVNSERVPFNVNKQVKKQRKQSCDFLSNQASVFRNWD